MKRFFTIAAVALMIAVSTQPVMQAQTRRPGQTSNTRPGNTNVTTTRPGQSTAVSRPGNSNIRPGQSSATRPSTPATRPGQSSTISRPGTTRPGASTSTEVKRPGQTTRPTVVSPPQRPNRLPSYTWTRPVRPSSWRPGSVRFNNMVIGLNFGISLNNSLNYLNSANYTIDGYDTDQVYLRNVTEMNYRWEDATLFYSGGYLTRSQFYNSSIGYNTSCYYTVMNYIKSLYGQPAVVNNTASNSLSATWFGPDDEYVVLEYRMISSSSGYRYFTILTIGR